MHGNRRWITHLLCGRTHARASGVSDDEAVARLAELQHGVISRRQLLELGLSKRSLEHRVAVGRLRPLFRGVYAVGHTAIPYVGQVAAAILSCSPGAVASHLSAAALWRLAEPPDGVAITADRHRARRPGVVGHRGRLPACEVTSIDGVPVTTVPRIALDLAATTPPERVRRLIKDAEYRKLVTVADLAAILDRHPRRRGRRNLVRIVEPLVLDSRPTRSGLEDEFLAFCRQRGLPLPETNARLLVRGSWYEPDCVWRDARLIVELDGRDAHARELAFDADRARDRALIAAGWVPMRITAGQLAWEGDSIESEIRAAIDLRAPARGTRAGSTTP